MRTYKYSNTYSQNPQENVTALRAKGCYSKNYIVDTYEEDIRTTIIDAPLASDKDTFSDLPECVYVNADVKNFLGIFRKNLQKRDMPRIALPKLYTKECFDNGMEIDWIYKNFRVYFSFDSIDGNFYGIIKTNPEKHTFFNEFKQMQVNEYNSITNEAIDKLLEIIMG